jgi:hypothetical protein
MALTKVELSRSIRTVSPTAKKVMPLLTIKDIQAAYLHCNSGYAIGWGGSSICTGGNSYCNAVKLSTGESIVIMCNSN